MKKLNLERLTERLGLTVIYFPIFRQARPDFFPHVSVFRYRDNMQISWNFRENSQILVAFFKAPAEKPKQCFISRARRIFRHLTPIKWPRFDSGHMTKSLFAIID